MMIEDAPTSPRSSAIYYWGGDWSGDGDDDDARDGIAVHDDFCRPPPRPRRFGTSSSSSSSSSAAAAAAAAAADGRYIVDDAARWCNNDGKRAFLLRRRRYRDDRLLRASAASSKFELSLRDDGDEEHWMFARAPPPPSSSSPSSPSSSPSSVCRLSAPPSSSSTEEEEGEEEDAEVGPSALHEEPMSSSTVVGTTTTAVTEREEGVDGDDDDDPDRFDFDAIPVVDLSLPDAESAIRIGEACRTAGFFYVVNHGVGIDVAEGAMEASRRFFRMGLKSKSRVAGGGAGDGGGGGGGGGYRGYFEIGAEDLENRDGTRDLAAEEGGGSASPDTTTGADGDGRRRERGGGDFKEGYDCGLEGECDSDDGDRDDARVGFFGRNLWPDEAGDPRVSGFREALLRYQAELIGLSDRLLLALGRSLRRDGVPEDYFVRRSRKPMCTLRLLHYPPAAVDGGGGRGAAGSPMGCGAHTDYGLFTILQQDSIGGLQVRNRSGRWIDARPLRGSLVINVGDMLSRWTGGEYASTVHRVVCPPAGGGHRYSVPFFFNPDHDAVVRPLVGGGGRRPVGGGGEESAGGDDADGGGRTALEILADRYNGTFKKTPSKS